MGLIVSVHQSSSRSPVAEYSSPRRDSISSPACSPAPTSTVTGSQDTSLASAAIVAPSLGGEAGARRAGGCRLGRLVERQRCAHECSWAAGAGYGQLAAELLDAVDEPAQAG